MIVKIDKSGRITIPYKFRKILNFVYGDKLEVTFRSKELILTKTGSFCVFCNSSTNIIKIGEHRACHSCIEFLNDIKDGKINYFSKP